MTDIDDDPFAPKTDNPVSADTLDDAPPAVVKAPAVGSGEGKLVTTLKGGGSFTDPWIVLHAESLEETEEFFSKENAPRLAALMERVQNAGKHFVKLGGGSDPAVAPSAQARSNAPAAAQSAPGGETRQCKHGDRVYKTGSSNGKAWKAFMCPTPKDTPDQCSPEFLR